MLGTNLPDLSVFALHWGQGLEIFSMVSMDSSSFWALRACSWSIFPSCQESHQFVTFDNVDCSTIVIITIQLLFSAVIQNIDLHLIYATIFLSLCRSKLNINTLKYMAGLVIEMGTPEILLAWSSIIERQYPGQYPLSIAPTTKPHTWP